MDVKEIKKKSTKHQMNEICNATTNEEATNNIEDYQKENIPKLLSSELEPWNKQSQWQNQEIYTTATTFTNETLKCNNEQELKFLNQKENDLEFQDRSNKPPPWLNQEIYNATNEQDFDNQIESWNRELPIPSQQICNASKLEQSKNNFEQLDNQLEPWNKNLVWMNQPSPNKQLPSWDIDSLQSFFADIEPCESLPQLDQTIDSINNQDVFDLLSISDPSLNIEPLHVNQIEESGFVNSTQDLTESEEANEFNEDQNNIVRDERNDTIIKEQNDAAEIFFTKENTLEESELISELILQMIEDTQMINNTLPEKNIKFYEKKENEIKVIANESTPEIEKLIENEMPPENNEEQEIFELIKIPPQNPSEPKPINFSIGHDYLTSLDAPSLTKSSGKIPSKLSAGKPPLRKHTSCKPYNYNQKKSSNKIIIDEPICEIDPLIDDIEESSKRPPIKLSIKGILGNSPCTVEMNEPLQKQTFDNELVQISDTFKSLPKFDEGSKIDEFSMPSTSGISSNKVASEYNFDFTSDSELSEKEPIGRKLHKKRKKKSHQTSDEEPWMIEPKKHKIDSNMLTPKQKPNEKSSHKAEKFSSKMSSKSSDHATRHKHHSPIEPYQKSTKNKSLKSPSKKHGKKGGQSLEPKNEVHSSSQASSTSTTNLSIPFHYREYYGRKGIIFKGINFDFFGL